VLGKLESVSCRIRGMRALRAQDPRKGHEQSAYTQRSISDAFFISVSFSFKYTKAVAKSHGQKNWIIHLPAKPIRYCICIKASGRFMPVLNTRHFKHL